MGKKNFFLQELKYGSTLEDSIHSAYEITSKQLINLLFTKYKFKEHLIAIKQYLLLGQGDFIQHLMVQLGYMIQFTLFLM